MQAPRYVEDNANMLKYRAACYDDHKKKLKKIQGHAAFEASVHRQTQGIEYYNTLKGKNKNFRENERNTSMNRTNQILLNKLVDISHGKRSSVNGPTAVATQVVMTKKRGSISQQPGPRSLNISVRKRENDRIERENHAFAKRLFENCGSVPQVHSLENQFCQNRELKQRVMRVKKTLPGLTFGKRTALQPLEERSVVMAKGQQAMSGAQLTGTQSKKNLSSPSKKQLINANSEREIVYEQAEPASVEPELAIEDSPQQETVKPVAVKHESPAKSMAQETSQASIQKVESEKALDSAGAHSAEYAQVTQKIEDDAKELQQPEPMLAAEAQDDKPSVENE